MSSRNAQTDVQTFNKTAVWFATVNGREVSTEVAFDETLLATLRNRLLLTGTKGACFQGECGACAVLVDGVLTQSCLTPALQSNGLSIQTVEGLSGEPLGKGLQDAFLAQGACQCGYCIPGMLMAAKALLADPGAATMERVQADLEGNLCRCTGYSAIRRAVESVGALPPRGGNR